MKMPINCPVCGTILLNEYRDLPNNYVRLIKTCNKTLKHKISWEALDNMHDTIFRITIENSIEWNIRFKYVSIMTSKGNLQIPFFEPNFSNYKRLIEKLKTYMVFS